MNGGQPREICKCQDLETFFFHCITENNVENVHSYIQHQNSTTVYDSYNILKQVVKTKNVNFYLTWGKIELLFDLSHNKKEIKYFPNLGRFCFFDSYYTKCNCKNLEEFQLHKLHQETNVLHHCKLDGKKMLLSEAWSLQIDVTQERQSKSVDMYVNRGNVYLCSQPDPQLMYAKIDDLKAEREKFANKGFFKNVSRY